MKRLYGSFVGALSMLALIWSATPPLGIAAQDADTRDLVGSARIMRGQDSVTVVQEMPPDSTKFWRGVQQLFADEKASSFSSIKRTFGLLEAKPSRDDSQPLSFQYTSFDGIVADGFYGEVKDAGVSGVRATFILNPKMICIPEREVERLYKKGDAVTPLPPPMAEIPPGVENSSDRSGYWHGVKYRRAAKNFTFHFFPSGCASDVSIFWER